MLRGDEPHTPSAPKQRALIALLLLHTNQLVPTDRIIDELWRSRPPRSAVAALQMYVSAVRRALTPGNTGLPRDPRRHPVLETRSNGYLIRVVSGQLDLDRFRSLSALGRAHLATGDCVRAGELFRDALAQWRGPALADLGGSLAHYADALEEERLSVLQQRIGADLCRGRWLEVVGELTELCARYPLREGFHHQLMTAQCLDGRRVDALRAYARAYRTMAEEAGVEPGPALRAAHAAILRGGTPVDAAHAGCVQPARA